LYPFSDVAAPSRKIGACLAPISPSFSSCSLPSLLDRFGYATSIDKVEEAIEKTMPKFKDNPDNAKDDEKAITAAWNTVQKDYACCGSSFNKTHNSWTDSGAYPVGDLQVPETCCLKEQVGENNIQKCRKDPHSYNLTGCFDKFDDLIEGNKKSVLAVGVTIVVIMFLNMLFAFAMCTMVD